jgi:DNA-binding GntR family transcriptional regulator
MAALSRSTRAEQVRDTLRQALYDGLYICGERLVESRIAQEMGVSQNTVRDALHLLEAEGWVSYQARQGVSVRAFTADEAEEIYALWATIERLAFRWAITKRSRVDLLQALRAPVEQAHEQLTAGHWTAARWSLFQFHARVAEQAGRTRTCAVLMTLRNQAFLLDVDYELHSVTPLDGRDQRLEAYVNLLGIIKFGDLASAEQALHDRIMDEGRPIIRWLAMNE